MLKFILDFVFYIGTENSHAQQVFYEGGDMALHLAKLLALAHPPDGKHLPPWHPDTFDPDLVDEDISQEDISQKSNENSEGSCSDTPA